MMRRGWRWLAVVGLMLGLLPLAPFGVAADDTVVSVCTEQALDQALEQAHSNGGGTITITCNGVIPFNTHKEITASVKIVGVGTVAFDGQGITRLFWVHLGATLELERLTLKNANSAGGFGAAVFVYGTLKVTASTFVGNEAVYGGAIWSAGTVEITASTFVGNSTALGGAIFISGGSVEITASTFVGNFAHEGGAIFTLDGTVEITASTFSGNSAAVKGGAFSYDNNFTSPINLRGTILANNSPANCSPFLSPFTSEGYNLSDDDTCEPDPTKGDIVTSTGIKLGPLQDNGGPTMTMLPLPGSAAIEAIPPPACATLSSARDQRGLPRPLGVNCEIGAVEVQDTVVCASRSTGQLSGPLANGQFPTTSDRLLLPAFDPVTLCIHPYTGALSWAPRGACVPSLLPHVVPDDGPLAYCEQLATGKLRYTRTGACSPAERAGVIPGV